MWEPFVDMLSAIDFFILSPVISDLLRGDTALVLKSAGRNRKTLSGELSICLTEDELERTWINKLMLLELENRKIDTKNGVVLIAEYVVEFADRIDVSLFLWFTRQLRIRYSSQLIKYLNEYNLDELFDKCKELRAIIYRHFGKPDILIERFKETEVFNFLVLMKKF